MFNWLLCTILELGEVSAPVGVLEAADSKKTHRPSLIDCQVPGILLAISAKSGKSKYLRDILQIGHRHTSVKNWHVRIILECYPLTLIEKG